MSSIRERAIEQSVDPNYADIEVPKFDDPTLAKAEADTHLMICIDDLIERLVSSDKHRQLFLDDFGDYIAGKYPGRLNTKIDHDDVIAQFSTTFGTVYRDSPLVDEVLQTTPGQKARKASNYYVKACQKELGVTDTSFVVSTEEPHSLYAKYKTPHDLLRDGLFSFQAELESFMHALNSTELTTESREVHLLPSGRSVLQIASLAMAQAEDMNRGDPVVHNGRIDTVSNIAEIRKQPKYHHPKGHIIRPHHMCLALPELPKNSMLNGGSGLQKLWEMTCGLIVATNMHALDDDRPKYRIAPPSNNS